MKHPYAIYAGLLAIGLACAEPATAQVPMAYPPVGDMPPYEVVALVRSARLEPVSRPVRHGPAYVLQAVNPAGREVRVIVDARLRRIVRVVATGPARPAAAVAVPPLPEPYPRPPAGIASVPDGNGPSARVTGLPPDDAEPYGQVAGIGTTPVMPSRTIPPSVAPNPSANPTTTQSGSPPLPRSRPKFAAAEPAAPVPAATGTMVTSPPPVRANGKAALASVPPPELEPVYEQHE